jgi:hypothetical protein
MFESRAAIGKYWINKLLSHKTILAKIHPVKYGVSMFFSQEFFAISNLKSQISNGITYGNSYSRPRNLQTAAGNSG